jgi:hypothetical protein
LNRLDNIVSRRLRAQRLIGTPFDSPVDALRWFGAVQAQDYPAALWALGQRTSGATEARLNQLFDQGAILRTHVMRPTWHFVAREDIRWLIELTAANVNRGLGSRHLELGIDEETIKRSRAALERALAGRQLTRAEIGRALEKAGISPEGQRLPHLLGIAERDGAIVSGPRRGRELTYALLEERAPKARRLDRERALAQLTLRYFQSHGPAQLADFTWWSGLSIADARQGIEMAGKAVRKETIEGREYWSGSRTESGNPSGKTAHLLPNFDEYTVAYRERGMLLHPSRPFNPSLFSFGSILANVLLIEGLVAGSWKRSANPSAARVEIRLLGRLARAQMVAVEKAASSYSAFLERPVELQIEAPTRA